MKDKIIATCKQHLPSFEMPDQQEEYYQNLFYYFSKDKSCEWDLQKGLVITGEVGCGKSLSMSLAQKIFRKFTIIVSRYLIREFLQEGTTVIDRYGRECFQHNERNYPDRTKPLTKCFDDLGLEEVNQKLFGNQQNVMAEILLDRYDMFIQHGMVTYATTNLTPEMIEQHYGLRIRDRLKEMCNYVVMPGKSKRQ